MGHYPSHAGCCPHSGDAACTTEVTRACKSLPLDTPKERQEPAWQAPWKPEGTSSSPAMSFQRPLLTKSNTVPVGKEKVSVKGPIVICVVQAIKGELELHCFYVETDRVIINLICKFKGPTIAKTI